MEQGKDCQHLELYKCRLGNNFFYKCISCRRDFAVPEYLTDKLTANSSIVIDTKQKL